MRRRRLGMLLAATGAVAAMSMPAAPAFAGGGGATVEEFVCYHSAGDRITLGLGRVITTPSGEVRIVCTGQRL